MHKMKSIRRYRLKDIDCFYSEPMLYVYILHPRLSVYTKALFETTASALGSASGSVLSSEALDEHVRKAHAMVNRGSKLP